MVSQHIGNPFALHYTSQAFHKNVIPNGCLKVYAKSPIAGEVLKCVSYQVLSERSCLRFTLMSSTRSSTPPPAMFSADALIAAATETINFLGKSGLGAQRAVETYNMNSEEYEEFFTHFDYTGPQRAAKTIAELYPEQNQRETVRILDVAAGTGLVAVEMHKLGFRNMDALDPSQGMLDLAAKRGVYNQMFTEYINETKLPIADNSYDSIVISGGIGVDHIPSSALNEMVRIVKPGGYIVNVARVEIIKNCSDYVELMNSLETEGRWKQITRGTFPGFLRGKEGIVLVHQVLQS